MILRSASYTLSLSFFVSWFVVLYTLRILSRFDLSQETQKWRPNGNDCWFAKVGTPAPSVYTARSNRTARSKTSARTGRSSARSTSRSSRRGPATGSARSRTSEPGDDLSWEMSASELWDKKIQLERQLEAVREEQDALMCEQLSRVNVMNSLSKKKWSDKTRITQGYPGTI